MWFSSSWCKTATAELSYFHVPLLPGSLGFSHSLLGLLGAWFRSLEQGHPTEWEDLPDSEDHSPAQPPGGYGAGLTKTDCSQHLQQTGSNGAWFCLCMLLFSRSVVSDSASLWIVARQAPLPMGFSRQELLEGVAISSSRGSSRPRDGAASLTSPALQADYLLTAPW